jgi:hypothetical protein
MNIGNDELKAGVQSQGEDGNLQESPAQHTPSGIAKSLYADPDGASSNTKSGPLDSGDIIAHGDELTNIGENTTIWQFQGGNNTRYVLARYYATLLTLSEVAVSMKALL